MQARPLLEIASRFAFPRFPGTPEEGQAADSMTRHFEESGLEVEVEPFEANPDVVPRLRRRIHGAVSFAILLMGALGCVAPPGAAVVGLAILAFVVTTARWSVRVEREYDRAPRITSRNVSGRRSAADGGAPQLVFLAHLDSKSARFPTAVPVGLILFAVAVVVGITLWATGTVIRGGDPGPAGVLLPLSIAGAAGLVAALFNPAGNESPGAMDNASGLAILHEAARVFPSDPTLAGAELVFLATGAEEIGLAGAVRWIQAHADAYDRDRAVFVNVDSVGVGTGMVGVDVRGVAPGGRPMDRVVRAAARAAGVRLRLLPFLPGVGVDTMPIGARGFSTVSLLGDVLGAPGARIHSPADEMLYLTEEALESAMALVTEVARDVARARPEARASPPEERTDRRGRGRAAPPTRA
jgi:hypothetical protein